MKKRTDPSPKNKTVQASLEDLICFALQACGADPSAALETFRSQVAGQMDHVPDPLFLAEVAATKRKLTEMMAILTKNAVNGEVHESHFLRAMEEAAHWSSRFGNPQN